MKFLTKIGICNVGCMSAMIALGAEFHVILKMMRLKKARGLKWIGPGGYINNTPRNASKNTIKRVMRIAMFYREKGFYYNPNSTSKQYFFFNEIGAQIYRMSKGKICNRGLIGVNKYKT